VVVTTGALSHAKLQSNCHHQQTNTVFIGQMPFLLPNQQCQSTDGNVIIIIIIIIQIQGTLSTLDDEFEEPSYLLSIE